MSMIVIARIIGHVSNSCSMRGRPLALPFRMSPNMMSPIKMTHKFAACALPFALAFGLAACGTTDDSGLEPTPIDDVMDLDGTVEAPDTQGDDDASSEDSSDARDDFTDSTDTSGDADNGSPGSECGALGQQCCAGDSCEGDHVCSGGLCRYASTASVCGDRTPACFAASSGSGDAPVNIKSGSAPSLSGGDITDSNFTLRSIDAYLDGTFTSMLGSVGVSSNGDTNGGVKFEDGDWSLIAHLDLFLSASIPMMGDMSQPFEWDLITGGCFEASGSRILGDIMECSADLPDDFVAPETINYGIDGDDLQLLIIITEENIAAMLPPEYAGYASMAIQGPLPLMLNFSAD